MTDDLDNPWPTSAVLSRLTDAAQTLLDRGYDADKWEEIEHCIRRAKEILAAPVNSPQKVKALEWTDFASSTAYSAFGLYDVLEVDGIWTSALNGGPFLSPDEAPLKSRDIAKAACQADFERRVMECIETKETK